MTSEVWLMVKVKDGQIFSLNKKITQQDNPAFIAGEVNQGINSLSTSMNKIITAMYGE